MSKAKNSIGMPIPNIITSLRMFLGVLMMCFAWAAAANQNPLWTIVVIAILFIIIVFSDFLDGYAARLLKMSSNFGRIFDQIADKICINVILIYLATQHVVFFIFPVIFITRDLIVNGIRLLKSSQKSNVNNTGCVIPAGKLGKIKTLTLFIAILLIFLILIIEIAHYSAGHSGITVRWSNFAHPTYHQNIFSHGIRVFIYNFILIIPVGFAIISLFSYVYTHLLSKDNKKFIYETIFRERLAEPYHRSSNHQKHDLSEISLPKKPVARELRRRDANNQQTAVKAKLQKQSQLLDKSTTMLDSATTGTDDIVAEQTNSSDNKLLLDETVRHDLKDVASKIMQDVDELVTTDNRKQQQYDIHDYVDDTVQTTSSQEQTGEDQPDFEKLQTSPQQKNKMLVREATATHSIERDKSDTADSVIQSSPSPSTTNKRVNQKQREIDQDLENTMSDLFIDPSQIVEYQESDVDDSDNTGEGDDHDQNSSDNTF